MGTWGTGLYSDDLAMDVRDYYREQLSLGKPEEKITQELIEQNRTFILDDEVASVFWFALADTQWNLGRLEENVKEKALYYLHSGEDLKRWEDEDPNELLRRKKVLLKLEEKLLSCPPEKKKISSKRTYICKWNINDVYAYPLNSDYAWEKGFGGRYLLFHKIGEMKDCDQNILPIVTVKITEDKEVPLDEPSINCLEYVKISCRNKNDIFEHHHDEKLEWDEYGDMPIYRLILMNTSARIIPKSLIYIGNFADIKPPKAEFKWLHAAEIPRFKWKDFEQSIVDRYCGLNLHQHPFYNSK